MQTEENEQDQQPFQKTWFDFYVHPQQLDEHIELLKRDSNVNPTAMELIHNLLHQLDKTSEQQQLQQQQQQSTGASSPVPLSPLPLGQQQSAASISSNLLELSGRVRRLWYLVDRLVDQCNFPLQEIETLPIAHQKSLLMTLIDYANQYNKEKLVHYQIMFHYWTLRSILNSDIGDSYILNPKHELKNLEYPIDTEFEYKIENVGRDSIQFLQSMMDKDVENIKNNDEMIETMAQFYFRIENFDMAKNMFSKVLSHGSKINDPLLKSIINACEFVSRSENSVNWSQNTLLNKIENVLQQIDSNEEYAQSMEKELIDYLIQDHVANALSLNYREQILTNFSNIQNKGNYLHFKITSCNLIKKLLEIIMSKEKEQIKKSQWKNYLTTSKYLVNQYDAAITASFALMYAQETLANMTKNIQSTFALYMIEMVHLVNISFVWVVLCLACQQLIPLIGEGEEQKAKKCLEESIRTQFSLIENFFEKYGNNLSSFLPIPISVFEHVQSRMNYIKNKVKQEEKTETQVEIKTKKRKYASLIQNQHYLISKQRRLSDESELYVPYLLHSARQRLYNSSNINTLSYKHAAHMLHDALSELKNQEMQEHSVKFDRSYEYDVILLNLAHKQSPSMPISNQNSKLTIGDKPKNVEEYEKLMTLLHAGKNIMADNMDDETAIQYIIFPPLPFLIGLLRFLVNLDDWVFIRDYFGTLTKFCQAKAASSNEVQENVSIVPLGIYCNFAVQLQELYTYSLSVKQSTENYMELLCDKSYELIYNLRSKYGSTDSLSELTINADTTVQLRKQKNHFYSIVETQNIQFMTRMCSILSFTLTCLRQTALPKDTPMHGHYFELSKCSFVRDISNPSLAHILSVWKGKEREIDEMVADMLKSLLKQIIHKHSDELCNSTNCQYYYFVLGDLYFERKQYVKALQYYLQTSQELLDHDANAQKILSIYTTSVLHPMVHCLNMMGEYTAAAALHQFLPIASAVENAAVSPSNESSSGRILGYDKRMYENLKLFNYLDKKWLLYFWDLSYIELLRYIEHDKPDSNNEKLLLHHIQRVEMNTNNLPALRKQYIEELQLNLLQKLYIYSTNRKD